MCRYLKIESIFAMVQWQRYSPPDPREKVQDLGKKKLIEFFKDYFRYKDNSVCPVNYDDHTSLLRRCIVAGIALIRDKEEYMSRCGFMNSITSNDVFDFVVEQLNSHDYVSNPVVYDTDEEYVAVLLYALASLQTREMMEMVEKCVCGVV